MNEVTIVSLLTTMKAESYGKYVDDVVERLIKLKFYGSQTLEKLVQEARAQKPWKNEKEKN